MPRRGIAGLAAAVGVALTLATGPTIASPPDSAIRYSYDGAGRLTSVTNPSASSALLSWDPVGNLQSVIHAPATALTVAAVNPQAGRPGDSVTITGTGFAAAAASNLVKFNGADAQVVSATQSSIVAEVPQTATDGRVTVSVGTSTATSASDFDVTGNPAGTRATS